MKYWEIIVDNLKNRGWRCDCISSTDREGRQFWVVAAEREDTGRFIVRSDEKHCAYRLPKLYPELGKTNDCARMLK